MEAIDMRVEDYLDDKLQSTADFESLNALIQTVEVQRNQLQDQLDNAITELEAVHKTSQDGRDSLGKRIEDFQSLQKSIDVRVRIATASDAPNQAILRLQRPMRTIRTVQTAQKYLLLLQDADTLRKQTRRHLPKSPKAALGPYSSLKELSRRLKNKQAAADDAAVHLVTYIESITENLWDEMRNTMSSELEAVLAERKWPMVDPHAEMDPEWMDCFRKSMDLEVPEVLYATSVRSLLPFDVMCKIFISEFRFHFLSDKPTSSPAAIIPQCFPWFLDTVDKWEPFFRDNLSHALADKFRNTPAAGNMVYVDPVSAMITSMLPVMREKIATTISVAANSPTFFSSFLGSLMTFDENIRSKFNYDGGSSTGWPGLTTEVLDQHFDDWFLAEKRFALERYEAIMRSTDGHRIDRHYGGLGKTKPTVAASRVTDLLKSVTAQYERVRRFRHRIRFLIGIQLDVLDKYHDRLMDSLQRYQAIASTVGRTLHGVTKEEIAALEGTGALETLCKVFGSADHVVATLKDWSNEEFFVTLWDELQSRARKEHQNLAGDMSYEEVKDKTSAAVGSEIDEGILFDETIAAYSQRRKAAREFLVQALNESHNKPLRVYASRSQWTTINNLDEEGSELAVTPELDEALVIIKRNLDFLTQALGPAPLRRTWREALEKLQEMLWENVLMRHHFTAFGAAQFTHDLKAIVSLVEKYIPGISASMSSLCDAVTLLGLPTSPEAGRLSLKEASDRIFTDNAEARRALQELGIETLTPGNARHILQRRVENSE